MSLLPTRDRESEEKFLRSLMPHPQENTIIELIEQAIQERRIQLAAQLVRLLPPQEEESDVITQARKAARFILLHHDDQEEDLYDTWMNYTQRKKRKTKKQRMRPKSPFHRRRPR
jgi:hypothetical protein